MVALNFWASWCEPALLDHGRAEEFIDDYGLTSPMLKDKHGKGLETFGVVQYSETFVIDRQGRIAAVRRGPVDEEFMRNSVEPLP